MLLNEKQQKVIKWIAYCIEILAVAVIVALSCALGAKSKTIKAQDAKLKAQTVMIDSLSARCDQLGSLNAITITSNLTITNKNYPLSVNTTQANLISKSIATATRNEVLDALDSLDKANK